MRRLLLLAERPARSLPVAWCGGLTVADKGDIDWQEGKPTLARLEADWPAFGIDVRDAADDGLTGIVEALRASHGNGGALLGRFSLAAPPRWQWYLSRNRFEEADFFARFVRHASVRQALPELGNPSANHSGLGFGMEQPHVLTGRLAGTVAEGGAYKRFRGSDNDLLRLVRAFTAAAFEDRYSDLLTYLSCAPWSPWFRGVAWDASFFWFDTRTNVATTLLVTDTD